MKLGRNKMFIMITLLSCIFQFCPVLCAQATSAERTYKVIFPFKKPATEIEKQVYKKCIEKWGKNKGTVEYMKFIRTKEGIKWAKQMTDFYTEPAKAILSLNEWKNFYGTNKEMMKQSPYVPLNDIETYQGDFLYKIGEATAPAVDSSGNFVPAKPIFYQKGDTGKLISIGETEKDIEFSSDFYDELEIPENFVGTEPDQETSVITITFPQIKIAKYNIEDISGTLALTKDDLNKNGELEIKGRVDDGANGANIQKVQVDVGEGWISLDSRVNLRYKFRPEENREYRLKFRAIDLAGKEHESIFGTIRLTYSGVDDEALIRQVLYNMEYAYQDEDVDRNMSFLTKDFVDNANGRDWNGWRDMIKSEFDAYESINITLSNVNISVTGNRARVSFIAEFNKTNSSTKAPWYLKERNTFRFEKINGIWKVAEFVAYREIERRNDDTTAPTIVSTIPVDGATGVSVNTGLSFRFSESMGEEYGYSVTVNGEVGYTFGDWSYNSSTYTWTNTSGGALSSGTTYTVIINPSTHSFGFKDEAGNPTAANQTFSFTTQ